MSCCRWIFVICFPPASVGHGQCACSNRSALWIKPPNCRPPFQVGSNSASQLRAVANDPPMLIADEPTGNLDSRTAEAVFQLFAGLVQAGKTVVMVTHDPDLVRRADRVITIADGMIVGQKEQLCL